MTSVYGPVSGAASLADAAAMCEEQPIVTTIPADWTARLKPAAAVLILSLLLLSGASKFVDPDAWHLMALFREALTFGALPLADRFAYTPTIYPVVQHEWGSGAILYLFAMHGGLVALQVMRFGLIATLAATAVWVVRRRGASAPTIAVLAPAAIVMMWVGLTAIRPQLFTLVLLAAWLAFLEDDRSGRRRWIPAAVVLFVVWLNLHAGFVAGLGFLLMYAAEQTVRRRPAVHLFVLAAVLVALIACNPYGLAYYPYLWRALTLARAPITEWGPIWTAAPPAVAVYAASVLIAALAIGLRGFGGAPGWPILVVSASMALRHQRHVSIYAVVWFCYVPPWLEGSRIAAVARRWWDARSLAAGMTWGALVVAAVIAFARQRPWDLCVPATASGRGVPVAYPVGAVAYLAEHGFRGNLLVPFEVGAFVSWKLHPAVKVSEDSRYEVAYPPELIDEHLDFYARAPGWDSMLSKYPTDLVLVPRDMPVAAVLLGTVWQRVYRDSVYEVFARPGLTMPIVNGDAVPPPGSFP